MARRSPGGKRKTKSGEETAQDLCQTVLSGEGVAMAEVGLAYADDATLRTLNSRYRDIDRTTDVLSFTYEDGLDEHGQRLLEGDIIISVPRLLAQAKRYKVTPGRELARLLTHGALHLCGHDHKRPDERKMMREREKIHLDAITKTAEAALTKLVDVWAAALD
jgi:probable rRNA maturation factor